MLVFLYSNSASEHWEKLHYVLTLLGCQPVSWNKVEKPWDNDCLHCQVVGRWCEAGRGHPHNRVQNKAGAKGKISSQGKGCGYSWNWLQKAVSWAWGRKLLDFLGKTPVDQCDSIRWAAFNNLFRAISARTMNLCASVTPHLFSDLIWKLIFPSFPLPFRSLSTVIFYFKFAFLLSKAFVRWSLNEAIGKVTCIKQWSKSWFIFIAPIYFLHTLNIFIKEMI